MLWVWPEKRWHDPGGLFLNVMLRDHTHARERCFMDTDMGEKIPHPSRSSKLSLHDDWQSHFLCRQLFKKVTFFSFDNVLVQILNSKETFERARIVLEVLHNSWNICVLYCPLLNNCRQPTAWPHANLTITGTLIWTRDVMVRQKCLK